jgi:glycosyl transferase family 2
MTAATVLCPVLARPHRVQPLAHSLAASLPPEDADVTLLFLTSPGDNAEIAEIERHGHWHITVPSRAGLGQYAAKINHGAKQTTSEWLLTGADDLHFHPGWLREALAVHEQTGALVIGTNDLANPLVKAGRHATHSLVHRDYLKQGTIDQPDLLLHPGYDHNAVDVEFTETAQARGVWAFAARSHVQHLHPTFDRGVKRDATYNKAMRTARRDKQLCAMRRHLWNPSAEMPAPPRARASQMRMRRQRPATTSRWPAR